MDRGSTFGFVSKSKEAALSNPFQGLRIPLANEVGTMGKRRQARELAVQVLFHMEYNPGDLNASYQIICDSFELPKNIQAFSRHLVQGIWDKKKELDHLISNSSKNWRLGRMSHVDRNILRLALFEILHMEDIPPKVSIDEAVELGKKYGTNESGAFINGILDNIYNHLKGEGLSE